MTTALACNSVSVIPETIGTTVNTTDRRYLLRAVRWRDLTAMRVRDGLVECLHPLPWIGLSWACAGAGWWVPATGAAFMIFLTALRLNHEAIHNNLGFSARGHRIVLNALSALMLGSNSAVAFNHLRHHRHVGHADDLEGKCGTMPAWRVLLYGPVFPIEMHRSAWAKGGPVLRRRMAIDFVLNGGVVAAAIGSGSPVLLFHVAAMLVAQCLTAFFAVWITHHGCDGDAAIARTQRSPLVNLLTYNMFLHLEHHLFPAVPVKRLARLAARLDAVCPTLTANARSVIPTPFR